jgi:hypothetical protein
MPRKPTGDNKMKITTHDIETLYAAEDLLQRVSNISRIDELQAIIQSAKKLTDSGELLDKSPLRKIISNISQDAT